MTRSTLAAGVYLGCLATALLAGLWAHTGARPATSGHWLLGCAALFATGVVAGVALTPGAL